MCMTRTTGAGCYLWDEIVRQTAAPISIITDQGPKHTAGRQRHNDVADISIVFGDAQLDWRRCTKYNKRHR